jgi:hypothetical protein
MQRSHTEKQNNSWIKHLPVFGVVRNLCFFVVFILLFVDVHLLQRYQKTTYYTTLI